MLTTRLNLLRAARILRRGGFTLVELLVVIGIIAILAGVALGPITNGIKKAKQSGGMQTAHVIGLAMYSYANDNSQQYPDGTTDASGPVLELLGGGYISDASIFFISNGQASKFSGTTQQAATGILASNISWDFAGTTGGTSGLASTKYQYLPIMWSTVAATGGVQPSLTGTGAITCVAAAADPFNTDGVAVFYINNSAKFVNGSVGTITMVTPSNNSGEGSASTAKALPGGG